MNKILAPILFSKIQIIVPLAKHYRLGLNIWAISFKHFQILVLFIVILDVKLHTINCEKNRVKGHPYSPYTPNLYYYSKNLQNTWPLRYPILDYVNHTGIKGIYDFC